MSNAKMIRQIERGRRIFWTALIMGSVIAYLGLSAIEVRRAYLVIVLSVLAGVGCEAIRIVHRRRFGITYVLVYWLPFGAPALVGVGLSIYSLASQAVDDVAMDRGRRGISCELLLYLAIVLLSLSFMLYEMYRRSPRNAVVAWRLFMCCGAQTIMMLIGNLLIRWSPWEQ